MFSENAITNTNNTLHKNADTAVFAKFLQNFH